MEQNCETDLSTKQKKTQSRVRLPGSDEDCRRTQNHQQKTERRALQAHCRLNSSPFAFPKSSRLLKRHQFLKMTKQGSKQRGQLLFFQTLIYHSGPKLGITVSRKHGKAHLRNRFKRRMRHLFRCSGFSKPIGMVISPLSPKTLKSSFSDLKQDFESFLNRL